MAPAGTKPQEGKNEGHCIELTMCAVLGLLVINGHRVLISKQWVKVRTLKMKPQHFY
jgi:hypothetical protein